MDALGHWRQYGAAGDHARILPGWQGPHSAEPGVGTGRQPKRWLPGGRSLPFGGQAAGSQPVTVASGSARADSRNGWLPDGRPLSLDGQAAGSQPRDGSSGSAWADSRNGWLPGGRLLPFGSQAAGSHPRHGSSGTLVGKLHKEQAMFLAGGTPAFSLTIGTEKGNLLHREHIWLGGKFP